MVDSTYSRVTATVSMTNFERRNAKKMAKELAKHGHTDIQQPPAQPRREGLRGRKFAYSNDEAPRQVVPRNATSTQPKPIPIPRLEGQEDIPGSDEEPETGSGTMLAFGAQWTHVHSARIEMDDDTRSQASTRIEEDHCLSGAESDSDINEGVQDGEFGDDHRKATDAQGIPVDAEPEQSFGEPSIDISVSTCASHSEVPASGGFASQVPVSLTVAGANAPFNNIGFANPDNNTFGAAADHPFGPPSGPSADLLGDASAEDVQLLMAAFPANMTNNSCFFDSTYGGHSVTQGAMDFAAPLIPEWHFAQPQVAAPLQTGVSNPGSGGYPTPFGFTPPSGSSSASSLQPQNQPACTLPGAHSSPSSQSRFDVDPESPGPGTPAPRNNHDNSREIGQDSTPLIPFSRLHTPDPTSGDRLEGFTSRALEGTAALLTSTSSMHTSNATPASAYLVPRPQIPTGPSPDIPHTPAVTCSSLEIPSPRPTCLVDPYSATPHRAASNFPPIPSTPAGRTHSTLVPHRVHATTPHVTPRSRSFQLPSTPRALPSRPLFRSTSTPSHHLAYTTPSTNQASLLASSNVPTASAPGSRSGTPSPFFHAPRTPSQGFRPVNPSHADSSVSALTNTPLRTGSAPSSPPNTGNSYDPFGTGSDTYLDVPPSPQRDHNTPDEPAAGNQGPLTPAPRSHRVRTPPPLARAYNRVVVSDADIEGSDGFVTGASDLEHELLQVQLIAPITPTAPTTAELATAKAKEVRHIQSGRKTKEKPGATPLSSRERIGTFSKPHQGYMAVLKAHFLWDFVTRGPWSEDEDDLIRRGKLFADMTTKLSGDLICTDIFNTTALKGSSQLRGLAHVPVQTIVQSYYGLSDGDIDTVSRLLARDRYLFPDDAMHPGDMFNVEIVGSVLATILFGTSKRIGILFMDRLLLDDDPADLQALFAHVALPALGGMTVPPTIIDKSPSARRGIPIPAIAYACIQINHALERIRCTKRKKVEFQEQDYGCLWADYVRKLAKHPQLGALRTSFLCAVQKEFCRVWVRRGSPQGTDHLW